MPILDFVRDVFASKAVRREARSEAITALRSHSTDAKHYLRTRLERTQSPQRRQIYRLAITLLPKLPEQ